MKKKLFALAMTAAVTVSAVLPAVAQPSVGVSIGINEPGVYGRINIGDLPGEALVAPQPVIVAPPRAVLNRRPIYLYVAPYEQANWARSCNRYGACGQPVYFVREDWVHDRYVREHPSWDRDHHWHGGPPPRDARRSDDHRFDDHRRDDGDRRSHDRRD